MRFGKSKGALEKLYMLLLSLTLLLIPSTIGSVYTDSLGRDIEQPAQFAENHQGTHRPPGDRMEGTPAPKPNIKEKRAGVQMLSSQTKGRKLVYLRTSLTISLVNSKVQ